MEKEKVIYKLEEARDLVTEVMNWKIYFRLAVSD